MSSDRTSCRQRGFREGKRRKEGEGRRERQKGMETMDGNEKKKEWFGQ